MDRLKRQPKRTARRQRFTVQDCLGKFQKFVLMSDNCSVQERRRKLMFYSRPLERFLETFPKIRYPERFDRVHVEDYRILRARAGVTAGTIGRDVRIIEQFWSFIIRQELNGVVDNIAKGFERPVPNPENKNSRPSLENLIRLGREIHDPRLANCVEFVLLGERVEAAATKAGLSYSSVHRLFRDAAKRAGIFGIGLSRLKRFSKDAAFAALGQQIRSANMRRPQVAPPDRDSRHRFLDYTSRITSPVLPA